MLFDATVHEVSETYSKYRSDIMVHALRANEAKKDHSGDKITASDNAEAEGCCCHADHRIP